LDYLDPEIKVYFGGNYNNPDSKLKGNIKKILGVGKKSRNAINKMRQNPRTIEIGMVFDVSKYMNESFCLVSPFADPHFARPVIEAYLHKKSAIGTDVEGMNEIIEQDLTGLLVKNNSGKELAGAINYLAKNPEVAQKMGEYAYNIALEKFTSRNILQIMNIYERLV